MLCCFKYDPMTWGAQIPGTMLLWKLNFVQWCLIFVGPHYEACFMLPY